MIPKFRIWNGGRMDYNPGVGFIEGKYTYRISDIFNEYTPEPMQCIGLLDKDGKEIYEEDIIYCEINNAKAIIKYNNKIGQYRFYFFSGGREDLKRQAKYHGTDMATWFLSTGSEIPITVIGNTYENPELMNQ